MIATVGSVVLSMLTGGGFSLVTRGLEMFSKSLDRKSKVAELQAEREHELALIKLHSEVRSAQEESERENALIEFEMQVAESNTNHAIASLRNSSQWVNDINSLIRPALTIGMGAAAVWLCYQAGDSINQETATFAVIDLAAMAYGWWFGDRSSRRMAQLNT